MLSRVAAPVNRSLRAIVFLGTAVVAGWTAPAVDARPARAGNTPAGSSASATAAQSQDDLFLAANAAFKAGDRERLATLAPRLAGHQLSIWVEFWQLQMRLRRDEPTKVDAAVQAFIAKYPDSYLADRLRMEWLLALGARGDLATFAREQPALVWQHDDWQVRCYAALVKYQANPSDEVAREARLMLASNRESGGDGCMQLTDALFADGRLSPWERVRGLVEQNQFGTAKRLAARVPKADPGEIAQAIDKPAAFLALHERRLTQLERELAIVAIVRLARDNVDQAERYASALNIHFTPEQRGVVWGRIGHMAAIKHDPQALEYYKRGGAHVGVGVDAARADEVLEWQVRAALRGTAKGPDWATVRTTIERMRAEQQRDPAWVYWRARALQAEGKAEEANAQFRSIAVRFEFYGKLAAEELGQVIVIPPRAAPPAPEMVKTFAGNDALNRALKLLELGLRPEGVREWGWALRNRSDRELIAIAEYARSRNALDRMINTSDRTREEFDFEQRFPSPHREALTRHAQAVGLDETWVYGLIRQESRFIQDARSSAGAQGLMQLMPATARYVARRVGMTDYTPGRITDLDVNLRLGTSYLRFVLDDLDGHPALASAAYNAGPGRPRQWRASLPRPVEGAIFAETIPFNETRDYVKKVMSNSVYYAALFENKAQSLKARLGTIAPKAAGNTDLP
jgi:soluble lytic murein transglycosylase